MNVFWPSMTHSSVASSSVARRPGRARVGTGLGFGETERAEHLARDHRDEVLLLLGLGPAVEERRRAEADAGLERDRHRRVDARDLLDRDAVRQVVGAGPAVLLGERQPEQPELAHRAHGVDGKRVIAVPGLGVRTRAEGGSGCDSNVRRALASASRLRSRPTRDFHKCHLQIGKGVAQDHRFFVCQVAARFFLNHFELIDEHPR